MVTRASQNVDGGSQFLANVAKAGEADFLHFCSPRYFVLLPAADSSKLSQSYAVFSTMKSKSPYKKVLDWWPPPQ